jgi:hypothetical protein
VEWRRAQERGALSALQPKKRGPAAKEVNTLASKVAEFERDLMRATRRAEALIEVQERSRSYWKHYWTR